MNLHGGSWLSKLRRAAIYLRDRERCLACGTGRGVCRYCGPLSQCYRLTLDHVRARAQGGSHASANLITLCCRCNKRRGDQPIADWRPDILARVRLAQKRGLARVRLAQKRGLARVDWNKVHDLALELWPAWYHREILGKARQKRGRGNSLEFNFGEAA